MKDLLRDRRLVLGLCAVVLLVGALLAFATTTSQPGPQIYEDAVTLHVSAATTATANGTVTGVLPGGIDAVICILDVTAALTDSGDLFDVYVQTKADGTNWLDVCHFTQVLGNGGTKRFVDKIHGDGAVTAFETGTGLSVATQRDLIGTHWRCRWTVTDAGTDNASWTFSVTIVPM